MITLILLLFSFSLRDLWIVRGLCHASVVAALTRPSYLPPGLTRADHSSHDTANPSAPLPRCSLLSTSKGVLSHPPTLTSKYSNSYFTQSVIPAALDSNPVQTDCSSFFCPTHTLTILPIPAAFYNVSVQTDCSSFPLLCLLTYGHTERTSFFLNHSFCF
jgi:hypothetical protein